jgi:CAAX prenyl protease-like protein
LAAPYLVPFLAFVSTGLVCNSISANGFDQFYGLRVLVGLIALAYFMPTYWRDHVVDCTWSIHAVAAGVVVFGIWIALEPLSGVDASVRTEYSSNLAGMTAFAAVAWVLVRTIGSIVVAPLVEELAFRGFLIRRLMNEDFASVPIGKFSWFSLLISSFVFGLMHGRWIAGTLAGLLFAAAMYRRGRLMDAVVAHATANTLVTIYALATGDLAAWS